MGKTHFFEVLKREALRPDRRLEILWIPAISMVPIANILILRGWREEVLRRVAERQAEILPEPQLGRFLMRGLRSWSVTLLLAALPILLALAVFPDLREGLEIFFRFLTAGPEIWWAGSLIASALISDIVKEPLKWAAHIPWTLLLSHAAILIAVLGFVMLTDHLLSATSTAYGTSRLAPGRAIAAIVQEPNAVLRGVGSRFAVMGGLAFGGAISALAGPTLLIPLMFGPAIYYLLTTATLGELVMTLTYREPLESQASRQVRAA